MGWVRRGKRCFYSIFCHVYLSPTFPLCHLFKKLFSFRFKLISSCQNILRLLARELWCDVHWTLETFVCVCVRARSYMQDTQRTFVALWIHLYVHVWQSKHWWTVNNNTDFIKFKYNLLIINTWTENRIKAASANFSHSSSGIQQPLQRQYTVLHLACLGD